MSMKIYKATTIPTVSGGNIEVKISANSVRQAVGLIKTLPYFKSFVKQPILESEENNLSKLADLVKKQMLKKVKIGGMK